MRELHPRQSIRVRLVMAFLLMIIVWGIVLTVMIDHVFKTTLAGHGFPAATIADVAGEFLVVCGAMTLAGLVLFFFIAHYLARTITQPVQQLMAGVETLGRGDLDARVPVGSADEFGELAAAFNRMAEQVARLDRLKSEFVSTVSHELRTPVTSIYGYAELLQTTELSAGEQRECLQVVLDKAQHLVDLVEGLLDIGRIEAGKGIHLERSRIDLAALIRRAVDAYRGQHPGHRFETRLPDRPVELDADPLRLGRVIDNLLSNSVKYSQPGTCVAVSLERLPAGVRISIADQGIGMTEEQLEHVFDKFYRVDSSDSAVGGVGLGLSIVRNLVEAHGGTIAFESAPGKGTTVSVELPLEEVGEAAG